MRTRVTIGCLALAAIVAMTIPAQAATVQFDMSNAFNEDVIVNGTTLANLDQSQASVDFSETSFITRGAAEIVAGCTEDPDGLPNTGRFAANDDHPVVNLAYDNARNGENARRSGDADRYRVAVPRRRYRSIHVLATTGNGDATMKVKLLYAKASSSKTFVVRDWFDEPGGGGYMLVDGRDRSDPDGSVCHDTDTAAIRGFKVRAKPKRPLRAVKITRPADDTEAVLNVFGMTGVRAN